ncbi:hypothetical protein [Phenylobacterium sp.]|uniref:hypothetical protein n=1 Tax=Phenylobacterium sp. TaxID=1871053 RepID=UPI00271FE0FB|nr:hypothetical protein [Phenylobacterium sp.]MDO8379598.1 hypothetical protein [Phenylobacterium sp.]
MPTYRFIIQGQGVKPTGEWFGFYAARQARAETEQQAMSVVFAALDADWAGPSRYLGQLSHRDCVAVWIAPLISWRRFVNQGHAFFGSDLDAQKAALRIEAEAASAPRRARLDLLRAIV